MRSPSRVMILSVSLSFLFSFFFLVFFFHLEPLCGFRSDFVYAEFYEITVTCNDSVC